MDRGKNIIVAESILYNDSEYINPIERIENAAKTLGPTSFKVWAWLSAQSIGTKVPQSAITDGHVFAFHEGILFYRKWSTPVLP